NNAVKFTHQGFVALNIYVMQLSEEAVQLRFEIKDSGIGIKAEQLNTIFESFTQVHETNGQVYEGAGLGLNIVRNLLNLMHGQIEVQSEEGSGTQFAVTINFDIPDAATITAHENLQTDLIIPAHWQYKRLLMIEDNQANILYAKNMFLEWGIEIDIATTLEEGKTKVYGQKYDCILSDVKLPDGNGMEFIKVIRTDEECTNQRTPIMVLTASANENEAAVSRQIEVQSYIGKPFRPELLVSELKKALDRPMDLDTPKNTTQPQPKSDYSMKKSEEPTATEGYFQTLEKNFKGKNKLKLEMINIFLDQIPVALSKMEAGIAEDNMAGFGFEAHRIKSTIKIIGLPLLQPMITQLDEFCYRKINLDQIPALFKEFREQARVDVQILIKEKERLSSLN
ncbi:MAG: ATP-binding protein, partial [Bacteroidota bacterium]